MTVPNYQTLMDPVLRVVSRTGVIGMRDLAEEVARAIDLSDEDRKLSIQSGMGLLQNRLHWSVTYLVKAGALVRPRRAHVEITERGRTLLESSVPVSNDALDQFPEFREFRAKSRKKSAREVTSDPDENLPEADESPQDLVTRALNESRTALSGDLLLRARELEPIAFERLVLKLLSAMGYGAYGVLEHSGRSGDAGVDGIISQDPLGLDRIFLQAKRYAADNVVHRPAIQGFVGALMGAQGDRGVFITTSSFSRGAVDEAARVNARIELIDGERLAELMIDYGVGVQPETKVTLHRLDEDFFEVL